MNGAVASERCKRLAWLIAVLVVPNTAAAEQIPEVMSRRESVRSTAISAAAPFLPGASAATGAEGSDTVAAVRLTSSGDGRSAIPPRQWTPVQDPASGLRVEHRSGQRLDIDWVRQQFSNNRLGGTDAGVARVLALVELLNRSFISAGFVNSGLIVVPQAAASTGIVELKLVYGRLVGTTPATGGVEVRWADGHSRGLTEDYLANRIRAARDEPLSAISVERDFRLLADDPAIRSINADLRPGNGPGQASLLLTVTPEDPFDIYVTYANNRSPSVGGERVALGGFKRNLLSPGDLLKAEFGSTDGLDDGLLTYVTPFFGTRTFATVRASFNNAAVVDAPLLPLDISSRDRAAEIGLSRRLVERPLVPVASGGWSAAQSFTLGASVAHRSSRSYLFGEPFSFSPGSVNGRSRYQAGRITADYVRRSVAQAMAATLILTVGLDGTRSDIPEITSPSKHFLTAQAQFNYARRLSPTGLELRARLGGQLANGVLYSGERISAGGEASVRGYRENLLLTDEGVAGSIELLQPFSLGRAGRQQQRFAWGAFAVSVFAEGAYANNIKSPDPIKRFICSVGPSLAWIPSDALSARISYGHALVSIRETGARDLQDRGINFRITINPLRLFGI